MGLCQPTVAVEDVTMRTDVFVLCAHQDILARLPRFESSNRVVADQPEVCFGFLSLARSSAAGSPSSVAKRVFSWVSVIRLELMCWAAACDRGGGIFQAREAGRLALHESETLSGFLGGNVADRSLHSSPAHARGFK